MWYNPFAFIGNWMFKQDYTVNHKNRIIRFVWTLVSICELAFEPDHCNECGYPWDCGKGKHDM
jgi:hypothetical protein